MTKYSQKSIIHKIEKTILEYKLISEDDRLILGLSGGVDSICLLEILIILSSKYNFSLSACHFNHQLRGDESDLEQKFVEKACHEKNIPLFLGHSKQKNSLISEDKARVARYEFFDSVLTQNGGEKIVLAHHANDVAETFLMRVIRGAGLKGLSAIPIKRDHFIRPMLKITRFEIEEFAKLHKLSYCHDSSNLDQKYFRNQVRQQLLPELQKINPIIVENLAALSEQITLDYEYLELTAQTELDSVALSQTTKEIILDGKKFLSLHPAIQKMVLRLSIERIRTLKDISGAHIDEVLEVINKGVGKKSKRLPNSLIISYSNGKISIV